MSVIAFPAPEQDNAASPADFALSGGGTLFLLTPLNETARDFLEERLDSENVLRWAGGIAIEHRYVESVVADLVANGFVVEAA